MARRREGFDFFHWGIRGKQGIRGIWGIRGRHWVLREKTFINKGYKGYTRYTGYARYTGYKLIAENPHCQIVVYQLHLFGRRCSHWHMNLINIDQIVCSLSKKTPLFYGPFFPFLSPATPNKSLSLWLLHFCQKSNETNQKREAIQLYFHFS